MPILYLAQSRKFSKQMWLFMPADQQGDSVVDTLQQLAAEYKYTPADMVVAHFLPNARDFEIVGGQFVLGDLHNDAGPRLTRPLPLTSQTTNYSTATLNGGGDIYSESEIYTSQLLRQKRGYPLYVPGPQRNLPAEYQDQGVSIVDTFYQYFEPGEHVCSPTVREHQDSHSNSQFPGGDFQFKCRGQDGAILALPHDAHVEKLQNLENVRDYPSSPARPRRLPKQLPLQDKGESPKKPPLACLFCRGRKIACGPPMGGSTETVGSCK
ncbi:hypothetical protein C8J57DRAFT_1498115 [Mycena rebaudengoi]|nr:hypothetical protein C8J57DRAFT_1498115 [Mycena rebaudengoi]